MRYFAWGIIAFVGLSVIAGVILVGSPATQRAKQFDTDRVNDLSNIQSQVVNYWQRTGALPASLETLKDPISSFIPPTDPSTGASYEYSTSSVQTFTLCATFAQPSSNQGPSVAVPMPTKPMGSPSADTTNWNWDHQAGRTCFTRTIDPAIYPPTVNPAPKASGGCVVTGCSSQICSDQQVASTCEWTASYACYGKYSTCERQTSGKCGWTSTPGLAQCLMDSRGVSPAPIPN